MTKEEILEYFEDINLYYNDCGRYNTLSQMIDKLLEQEPKWIPITTRPMTEEETEHYFEYSDMRIDDTYTILDCPLPDDGQEVLISINGYVETDVFIKDNDGCYFEEVDIDDVDAWMPLPEPYKAESEDKE